MSSLKSKIESLLFITNQPLSVKKLADLTESKAGEVKEAAEALFQDYTSRQDSGTKLIKVGDKYQLVSNPDNSKIVKTYIKDETTGELTRPQLETLTIIAYRSPISRAELEQIRGVNCAIILRNLMIRGLVEETEIKAKGGLCYQVSLEFLKFLGVSQVSELPDFEKLNASEKLQQLVEQPTEQ